MVGDILRLERERQKLSVKDIEQGTSIRALYIEAIENGEYDKLPGNVYTKGFIKNYGNFLKLDGESLVRQYVDETAPPPPIMVSGESAQNSSAAATEAVMSEPIPNVSDKKIVEPTEIKIKHKSNGSGSGLLVAAIVLIAAIAGGLWYYFTNIEGKEVAQRTTTQTQQQANSSTATPVSASTPDSAQAAAANNFDELNLQARFNDRCWTKVVVDGRIAYEGTAEAGQTLTWQANDRIIVTAGNAGAVEFIENGSNLGIAGAIGDVVEKTFVRR